MTTSPALQHTSEVSRNFNRNTAYLSETELAEYRETVYPVQTELCQLQGGSFKYREEEMLNERERCLLNLCNVILCKFVRFFPAQCLFAPKAQKGITKG